MLQLTLDGVMTLQVAYYNSRLALWEPLVEPVEGVKAGEIVPWQLQLQVSFILQQK